ncbi:hypothetical protein GCM10027294_25890 [Marinactinospora endophytica]
MYVTRPPQCRHLLHRAEWEALLAAVRGRGCRPELAERVSEQTLTFLRVDRGRRGLVASPLVDLGWHALISTGQPYRRLCAIVARKVIAHRPRPAAVGEEYDAAIIRTTNAIRDAGYDWDPLVWGAGGPACVECGQGVGA